MCTRRIGEVMGCLCERVGASVYIACKDTILEGVLTNLERQPEVEPTESGLVNKVYIVIVVLFGVVLSSHPGT